MKKHIIFKFLIACFLFVFTFHARISSAGEVYLVLGSDTAIWSGMDVGRYHCHYNIDLYTNPTANAYQVMDPAFRAQFVDSYGQPMKLTWWMMAGNIFRYADNKNMPVPNIMTLYLMKKYHGDNVIANGDELSLHYHTFFWSDYDGDGLYWWNQALTFLESKDDFDFTLAQFLLEEQVFPVSYRSGWHYMDNDWQHYLDERVLPYSMHNDWPAKRTDLTEPLDNTYDWSLSPSTFVPWRPSYANYQIPGDGPGWNVRSKHFNGTRYLDLMDTLFIAANNGVDQVACLWGHLPETDFLTNLEIIDSLAHKAAAQYPNVNFRYCTAIEAMQLWRQSTDSIPPNVIFSEEVNGSNVKFRIQSDEPIFQTQPYVAAKDIYERYYTLPCISVGTNEWLTTESLVKDQLAKAGVAVCDTFGNQTLEFIEYLPDDMFIDNLDPGYTELYGNWTTSSVNVWGIDSRRVQLTQNDSAKAQWQYIVPQTTLYNIFVQVPDISNPVNEMTFTIFSNQQPIDTIQITDPLPTNDWVYLTTKSLSQSAELIVEMKANGATQAGKVLVADVIKVSALVRDRDLYIQDDIIDFGQVVVEDTAIYNLKISNLGVNDLHIQNMTSNQNIAFLQSSFPLTISPMSEIIMPVYLFSSNMGAVEDTLIIQSDDPAEPEFLLPVFAEVQNYFQIIDNEDSLNYSEFGTWFYSNAQAYGPSSRYSWLNANPRSYAIFNTVLPQDGLYEIFEIVPTTVNATDDALYQFWVDSVIVDSLHINQNQGSGTWVSLGQYNLPSNKNIEVRVIDTGNSTVGPVLRADAIQFVLIQELSGIGEEYTQNLPSQFHLSQNYPNPFNPITKIEYQIPQKTHVKIEIFNTIGEKINTIVNSSHTPGYYSIAWSGQDKNYAKVASGIYFYRITAGEFVQSKKMIYLR